MKKLITAALLALAIASPAFAINPFIAADRGLPIKRADIPCAQANMDGFHFVVTDCVSKTSCASGGTAAASIMCDGGTYVVVSDATPGAATTTTAGIVELATDGETASNVVVQGNDSRLVSTAPPRTVRVDRDATPVAGKVYATVKEAVDYVATQTRSFSAKWQVIVQGGGRYNEDPFTIPTFTDLFCSVGAYSYVSFAGLGIGSTVIDGAPEEGGAFISMDGNSELRNCEVEIGGVAATMPRTGIDCLADSGLEYCHLDHVGLTVTEGGSQANVGIRATGGGGGTLSMYYVVVSLVGDNANAISIKTGTNNSLHFSNGIVGTGGLSGKGIQALNDSPSYNWIHNVRVGSVYTSGGPTTAISIEGTGAFYASDSTYGVVSGTITDLDVAHNYRGSAPPFVCSAAAAGREYYDTDINKKCICNGTNYVLANDDSTTTGCS